MKHPYTYTVASNHSSDRFHGLNVLFAGESQTKPGHKVGPKVYDYYLMHYILSGSGTFTIGETPYELHAGDTFLIEPEQLIRYTSSDSDPWMYRWIAFEGNEEADKLLASCGFHDSNRVLRQAADRRTAVLFHQVYRSLREGGAMGAVQAAGYLQLLFSVYGGKAAGLEGNMERSENGGETLVRQVTHYLSAQFAMPVSIEQMAETLGYNRAYLSRVFKRATGMTPVTFLLRLRIDKARLLLRERPELTVEQIAASVGIPDALYFSKQFKRLYEQSPSSYRRGVLQGEKRLLF
ncbi:AraC family transcriptional regulator [Paenibacillus sp. CCS19]|uniref:AraC family transcriptional regulator n=1 Tax=Paenibacillus sp. CCS19 TaxID=3158387 RepID=UPI0025694056|nr:AraC family transcriptional regulator [Paenibacillus cellulosilyticus]GMK42062.1 AraC family transcriptional regulator [Paenibacillus cellulosilyticus]